jgi:rfaE bifunctional protein kinase chain/domain
MGTQRIQAALQAMAQKRALLIGDTMLDAYVFGETARVSREAPVLVVREEKREYRLGAAANTAANLAALGLHVDVLGMLGDDASGRILRQLLTDTGCNLAPMLPTTRATATKTRILAGAYGTSHQQVLRLDAEPEGDISAAAHRQLAERLRSCAAHADVVVVSDYGAGMVRGPVIEVLQELAAAGKPVCVDSRYDLKQFTGMTALTPNVPEAEALVGFALHDRAAVEVGGQKIRAELLCEALVLTQGKQGMSLFADKGPTTHIDVVGDSEVTDVTGAGDSVIATLGAALAAGLGLKNGTFLANCAAGVVVTRMGTACASPQDIVDAAVQGHVQLEPWATC